MMVRGIRGWVVGAGSAAVLLGLATVWAGEQVTGEVVDLSCYLHHPQTSTGGSHRKCAETCAKKGLPMGLLTADKQVFLLLEDHENPKAYAAAIAKAAQQATVEGDKVTVGGVQGIVVESVVE
ncbi:MAG: hypothetical protein ACREQL_12455 [Candidatus Binatia bacterium]